MRRNALNQFRLTNAKLFLHWSFIILHLLLIIGSVTVLAITWTQTHRTANSLRFYVGMMAVTSVARIFRSIYERRWPLVAITEWGTEIVRPIDTTAAKLALFLRKNIDMICIILTGLIVIILDKQSSEEAGKALPLLYWTAIAWIVLYFSYFILPVFFILGLIACLPCLLLILQRFFNFSLVNPSDRPRAAPATRAVLEKVWKVKFSADESFKYNNPEEPTQSVTIEKEDTKCSICLGWYENGDDLRILPCSHHFHQGCADEWFKITATCPLCVRPIRPAEHIEIDIPASTPDSNV